MKYILAVSCFVCILRIGTALPSNGRKNDSKVNEMHNKARKAKTDDLEGAETVGKLFNLREIFPTYGSNPCIRPGGYPSTGGGYYPSTGGGYYPSSSGGYNPSNGYYPSSGNYPTSGYYPSSGQYPNTGSGGASYYPSGTNILGHGSGSYPSQSFYPISNPWYTSNTRTSGYGSTGSSSNYDGYGGYGGYGGNGGFSSYNGYNNPRYDGKRNLGYGYYSDTDRYGFYKSPSQQLSVYRGYN